MTSSPSSYWKRILYNSVAVVPELIVQNTIVIIYKDRRKQEAYFIVVLILETDHIYNSVAVSTSSSYSSYWKRRLLLIKRRQELYFIVVLKSETDHIYIIPLPSTPRPHIPPPYLMIVDGTFPSLIYYCYLSNQN